MLERTEPGRGGEIQLTDALQVLAAGEGEGYGVYGVVFRGRRYDTGDKLSYLKACVQLAIDSDDLGPGLREWLPELHRRTPQITFREGQPSGRSRWSAETWSCVPSGTATSKEWTEVRSRNSEWLAPWEASNPAPGGALPDYRQMVRSLNAQAAQSTALPFLITERTARVPRSGHRRAS